MMNENHQSRELQTLKIIVNALLAGPTLFLVVVVLMILSKEPGTSEPQTSFKWFAAAVIGLWMISLFIKNRVEVFLQPRLLETNPMPAYRNLLIVRMAISEGAALVGLVGLIIFAPGAERQLYFRLLVFLLPYFSLLASGVRCQPSEHDLENRAQVAKANKRCAFSEPSILKK